MRRTEAGPARRCVGLSGPSPGRRRRGRLVPREAYLGPARIRKARVRGPVLSEREVALDGAAKPSAESYTQDFERSQAELTCAIAPATACGCLGIARAAQADDPPTDCAPPHPSRTRPVAAAKSECRNPKSETNSKPKIQMFKTEPPARVSPGLAFRSFRFWTCFVFRASDFVFPTCWHRANPTD